MLCIFPILGIAFSNSIFAQDLQKLSCSLSHTEASRLYDYIVSINQGVFADKIISIRQNIITDKHEGMPIVKHKVDLSNFNLDLLAVESIKMTVSIPQDATDPYGIMDFVVKRASQIMTIRDKVSTPLVAGAATRKTNFIPAYQIDRQTFVNLSVYPSCRINSPYFMKKQYVIDKPRDDTSKQIYPRGGVSNLLNIIGQAISK